MDDNQTLRAARAYSARGLGVFPLNGKVPITEHGVHDANTDLQAIIGRVLNKGKPEETRDDRTIERWLSRPNTNIGIAIPPGVVVVDVDPRNGGGETFAEWYALCTVGETFDIAPLALTGGGGDHYWFKYDGRPLVKAIDGVDFQRDGKYVVAPPSVTDAPYRWVRTLPQNLDDLPELPEWLLNLATLAKPERFTATQAADVFGVTGRAREYVTDSGDALGDAARRYATWHQLLGAHGWTEVGEGKWRHPNTVNDVSATIKHDCLFVYSPNTPFEVTETGDPRGITLYNAIKTLDFGGDQTRMLEDFRRRGYLPEHTMPRTNLGALMPVHDAPAAATDDGSDVESSLVPGGTFVFDERVELEARWGSGHEVLWAAGESCMIVGPPGVGKTTIAHQLVSALLGITDNVLGYPVAPARRVLYLAMDRPRQIRRAMRRLFKASDRHILDERLLVQRGPLPSDLSRTPEIIRDMALANGCDVVVVDSLKDAAIKLSDDETGGNVNRAIQLCNAEDIDVLALHHQRKGVGGEKPTKLEDVYGSTWLTAGTGSVLLLWGEAGAEKVELHHLKQPADPVGPLDLEHDHIVGITRVVKAFDLLAYLRLRGAQGATVSDAAHAEHGADQKTGSAKWKRSERRLRGLIRDGLATRDERVTVGKSTRYYATGRLNAVSEPSDTRMDTAHGHASSAESMDTFMDTFDAETVSAGQAMDIPMDMP